MVNGSNTPGVFLGMGAEKAFDSVNWQFMSSVLKYVGFGDTMFKWINTLYSTPSAQVKVNGVLSETLHERDLTGLVPVATALRPVTGASPVHGMIEPRHYGVVTGDTQQKVSAYANDMLFTLANPAISLPNLLRKFQTYGNLSNLMINLD